MRWFRPVLLVVGLGSATAVTAPLPAAGAETAAVSTDPTGAHVVHTRDGAWIERPPRDGTGGGPTTGCTRRWVPASGAVALRRIGPDDYRTVPIQTPQPGPEYSVYHVWCREPGSDAYVASVWLAPRQFGVDPVVIAERLVRDLPYPPATLGTSPAGRGLTGLPTWFWIEGYTDTPITDTVSEFGLTVDVVATPVSVSWDFGDGTTAPGGALGSTASPARAIHTYERRARPTFPVRALVRLDVQWRVSGGPWQTLPPVARTAGAAYPVAESRAALVPGR